MYVHTYAHHENRSLIQSLALMRSAIIVCSTVCVQVASLAVAVILKLIKKNRDL